MFAQSIIHIHIHIWKEKLLSDNYNILFYFILEIYRIFLFFSFSLFYSERLKYLNNCLLIRDKNFLFLFPI